MNGNVTIAQAINAPQRSHWLGSDRNGTDNNYKPAVALRHVPEVMILSRDFRHMCDRQPGLYD